MITFKKFLEGREDSYTPIQSFMIMCWGKLLYLDYESLPRGKDQSKHPELKRVMASYHTLDDDELQMMDEWIAEGGRMKDGTYLFTRETVDAVLRSAQHKAGEAFTLYRFDHTEDKLRNNSWISLSRLDHGYDGRRSEFEIQPDTMIIDADGLADANEVIMNTNELIK